MECTCKLCSSYFFMLADLKGHQECVYYSCEQKLPWCWTEEATPWISQQLGLLVFHIAVWFVCCTVLVLAVLTDGRWKLAATYCNTIRCHHMAWCCRQTQDVLHPAECPPAALLTSQWKQVSSLPLIAPEVVTACVLKTGVCSSTDTVVWHLDKCVGWYFA